jgi:hypothetical protein
VFVGSSPRHVVPERVLIHSVLSRSSRPVEINVIDTIGDEIRQIDADGTARSLPLPACWKDRMYVEGTGFHYSRFAAPQLCDYAGRAIYLEADQLVLADIAELWEFPFEGASCAAVPADRVRGQIQGHQDGGYASSVVLYDCSRCTGLDALRVCEEAIEPGYDRAQFSMAGSFLRHTGLTVTPLLAQWNDHEQRFPDTKLLHFTFQEVWPVDTPLHPESRVWVDAYLAAVDAGFLDEATLDQALELSTISRRVRTLPRLPRWAVPAVDLVWQHGEHAYSQARRAAGSARRFAGRVRRRL